LCSNVVVDHASTGIVVRHTIPVITSPPDFRPGLLSTLQTHPIQAPDGSPGVRPRYLTQRAPRPLLMPDPRRLTITTQSFLS